MTTPAGLLTLHPEPDETAMHGNVVGPDGVRHLALSVERRARAVRGGLAGQRDGRGPSVGADLDGRCLDRADLLHIDDELEPASVRWRVKRVGDDGWHFMDVDGSNALDDGRGGRPAEPARRGVVAARGVGRRRCSSSIAELRALGGRRLWGSLWRTSSGAPLQTRKSWITPCRRCDASRNRQRCPKGHEHLVI